MLHLRFNEPEIGTLVCTTAGDAGCRARRRRTCCAAHADHWLVREVRLYWTRTLKRLDLSARTIVALVEPGSCFAGTLAELVLGRRPLVHARRPDPTATGHRRSCVSPTRTTAGSRWRTASAASPLGSGAATTSWQGAPRRCSARTCSPPTPRRAGLVTFTPDDLDWDDEVRLLLEERNSFSPDALTGDGGQPPLRRSGDDGDEDLRPAHGLAELGLPAPERRRARRRAAPLRHRRPPDVRPHPRT